MIAHGATTAITATSEDRKFQSAPRDRSRGDSGLPRFNVNRTVFQSAPRDRSRGDCGSFNMQSRKTLLPRFRELVEFFNP